MEAAWLWLYVICLVLRYWDIIRNTAWIYFGNNKRMVSNEISKILLRTVAYRAVRLLCLVRVNQA